MASKNAPAVPHRVYADFCNKIGTKQTWHDVRFESVMRTKADIGENNSSGGPGGLGESGFLTWRAHMINEALTNWW
jgi:hypothetical protein